MSRPFNHVVVDRINDIKLANVYLIFGFFIVQPPTLLGLHWQAFQAYSSIL